MTGNNPEVEIAAQEILSLECPSLDEQERLDCFASKFINSESLNRLLKSINLQWNLVSFRPLSESKGIASQIYLVKARKSTNPQEEFILKLNNAQDRFRGRKTCEAALMNYVRENTQIPVPKILSHSCEAGASVLRCEYILMERMPGCILKDALPKNVQRLPRCLLDEIFDYIRQLKTLTSPFIGSFSHDSTGKPITIASYPMNQRHDGYFDAWNDSIAFYLNQMRKLKCHKEVAEKLDEKRQAIKRAVADAKQARVDLDENFSLVHGDLNETNVIVDPKTLKITGIIDWEWSRFGVYYDDLKFWTRWYRDSPEKQKSLGDLVDQELSSDKNSDLAERPFIRNLNALRNSLGYIQSLAFWSCNYAYQTTRHLKSTEEKEAEIRRAILGSSRRLDKELDKLEQKLNTVFSNRKRSLQEL